MTGKRRISFRFHHRTRHSAMYIFAHDAISAAGCGQGSDKAFVFVFERNKKRTDFSLNPAGPAFGKDLFACGEYGIMKSEVRTKNVLSLQIILFSS